MEILSQIDLGSSCLAAPQWLMGGSLSNPKRNCSVLDRDIKPKPFRKKEADESPSPGQISFSCKSCRLSSLCLRAKEMNFRVFALDSVGPSNQAVGGWVNLGKVDSPHSQSPRLN